MSFALKLPEDILHVHAEHVSCSAWGVSQMRRAGYFLASLVAKSLELQLAGTSNHVSSHELEQHVVQAQKDTPVGHLENT